MSTFLYSSLAMVVNTWQQQQQTMGQSTFSLDTKATRNTPAYVPFSGDNNGLKVCFFFFPFASVLLCFWSPRGRGLCTATAEPLSQPHLLNQSDAAWSYCQVMNLFANIILQVSYHNNEDVSRYHFVCYIHLFILHLFRLLF